MAAPVVISATPLRQFAVDALAQQGVPESDAKLVAESLLRADLRGVHTHGLVRLPTYVDRLRVGLIAARPELRIEQPTPWSTVVDGGNGLGAVVATRAMQAALAAADGFGIGAATAKRSNHLGAAAVYALQAVERGYIGAALTPASRALAPYKRAGVAGLHLEDQTFPKRCGHYADKRVVPVGEFAGKLRAARDALDDPDFLLIARTDAIAVEGLAAAIERMERYLEAGADMAFFDAPTSEEQVAEIARRIAAPKVINMFPGGRTPLMPAAELEALGYRLMIVPGDAQRAAIRAMQNAYVAIRRDGSTASLLDQMVAFEEREAAVDTAGWLARGRSYDQ